MQSGEDILVSVLMPVYNAETYLEEAIESIFHQTYKKLELLALYDNSMDGTWEILKEYAQKDKRLKILMLPHRGIAAALNIGLDAAKGKYIARMDADDISLPDRFAVQVAYMEEHPQVGVCAAQMRSFQDNGVWVGNQAVTAMNAEELKAGMLFQCMIGHPTVMFRKDIMARDNWKYHTDVLCEDFDLWSRMIETVPFVLLPDILLNYRYNEYSITKNRANDVFLSSCEIVRRALEKVLKIDTKNYKLFDFRGIHQAIWLDEPIVGHFKRQNQLLHEIYNNNQKLEYCNCEYLSGFIKRKWKFLFRNFGLMDQCSEKCQEIDLTKPCCDFSGDLAQEVGRIAEDLIGEMALPKTAVIYGAGIRGRKLMEQWDGLSSCGKLVWKLAGVADRRETGMVYQGKKIDCIKPSELSALNYDYILVSTDIYYDEIKTEMRSAGIPEGKIYHAGILNLLSKRIRK